MSFEDKPIALVTGLPGSGKTAMLVKYIQEAAEQGRPIIQLGIPELKISHFPPPPAMEDWTELREDPDMPGKMLPYFTFPEKSLVVLSEAQRYYRPRAAGAKLPDYVAAFETCRHTGVTFILDTQHPDFVDSHIRKLIGQHVHLLDHGVLGRKHYEWPYLGNPDQFKTAPIKKDYKLPKEIFGLYKSSSLHIKRKYTFPPALKLLIVVALAIAVGLYYVAGRIGSKLSPVSDVPALEDARAAKPAHAGPPVVPVATVAPIGVDPAELLMQFSPRVPSRPETAPAYDGLRQVKYMPVVVGCYQTKTRCACQNQQGLDAGLDDLQCRAWMASPPFDPYREPPAMLAATSPDREAAKPTGQALAPPPAPAAPAPSPTPI